MAYLNHLRKLTEEELRRFIAGKEIPEDQPRRSRNLGPRPVESRRWHWRRHVRLATADMMTTLSRCRHGSVLTMFTKRLLAPVAKSALA